MPCCITWSSTTTRCLVARTNRSQPNITSAIRKPIRRYWYLRVASIATTQRSRLGCRMLTFPAARSRSLFRKTSIKHITALGLRPRRCALSLNSSAASCRQPSCPALGTSMPGIPWFHGFSPITGSASAAPSHCRLLPITSKKGLSCLARFCFGSRSF